MHLLALARHHMLLLTSRGLLYIHCMLGACQGWVQWELHTGWDLYL